MILKGTFGFLENEPNTFLKVKAYIKLEDVVSVSVCAVHTLLWAVNVPVYGLPSRGVLHLVSLATKHINDCIVAEKVTCNQKNTKVMTSTSES